MSAEGTLEAHVLSGQYVPALTSQPARRLIQQFAESLAHPASDGAVNPPAGSGSAADTKEAYAVGLAALNAFLQINVTGPVLEGIATIESVFSASFDKAQPETSSAGTLKTLRRLCFQSLEVDGVSCYPYIPNIELFALARFVAIKVNSGDGLVNLQDGNASPDPELAPSTLGWTRLRIYAWHHRLLTQPSLGPGSIFNKSSQWSDVPSLVTLIEGSLEAVESEIHTISDGAFDKEQRVMFFLEKANTLIMLGQDVRARTAMKQSVDANKFSYTLTGALAKRTKFQEKSTSQLVVLAKSRSDEGSLASAETKDGRERARPEALPLNDDTLLESLEFSKKDSSKSDLMSDLPDDLRDLNPDEQPQLHPLDAIILLTEATLKDAFSPLDTLTSEEVLPYAVRVLSDKSTNWQVYTHALLVRSRIEMHRSRTIERGILQLQVLVDQIVAETTMPARPESVPISQDAPEEGSTDADIPSITVSTGDKQPTEAHRAKPTSFFPAPKQTETAPVQQRLLYVHALSSPPRWHLESELAYSWANVGSLISAVEIFKRLRLWAEVALCLASAAALGDAEGRASGGDEKGRAVVRWRLFQRSTPVSAGTGANIKESDNESDDLDDEVDVDSLKVSDYAGPERNPPPPNAPRLYCILGEMENDPSHYERAWEISKHRYARAQKSLGEHYLQQKQLVRALEAYQKAVAVNRLSSEMWNRLGDISLRMGQFAEAARAFERAIASASNSSGGGDDARTWSNLGSSLYSLYVEEVKERKEQAESSTQGTEDLAEDEEAEEPNGSVDLSNPPTTKKSSPKKLLTQALAAYKRGAAIAHDNWRIWDNVITLASRLRPPAITDMIIALRNIIEIRKTEDALDIDMLRLLLNEAVLSKAKPDETTGTPEALYETPRGSPERAVCELLEGSVVPLITTRSELWELIARERVWRRDFAGAVDAAERAWRAAIGGATAGGASLAPASAAGGNAAGNWLEDADAWKTVVDRTDELVSILENYGPAALGDRWKPKAKNALRSVMSKARDVWEGSEGLATLQGLLDGLA